MSELNEKLATAWEGFAKGDWQNEPAGGEQKGGGVCRQDRPGPELHGEPPPPV